MILYKILIHYFWLDCATTTEKYTSLVDTKLSLHRFSNGKIGLIMWKVAMQGANVTKNEGTNKQNAKHAYTEQQIHSPNFTLARTSGHVNFAQKLTKKLPSSS
jgi:hypothetical protein